MKFRNNFSNYRDKGEINNEPSLTIPGQVLPIMEQIRKSQQGVPLMVRPVHFTDSDIPLPEFKDLTDLEHIESVIKSSQEKWNKYVIEYEKHKKNKQDEEFNRKVEARIKELTENTVNSK